MSIDFKILKDEDGYYVLSFENTVTGALDNKLAEVILKLYVTKENLEHLRIVIDKTLFKD